jgi:uncharacterized protein
MPHRPLLGRVVTLPVLRFGPPGAFLAIGGDADPRGPVLLLPGAEVPEGTGVGDELEVFVTLDSEDRPLATIHRPKLGLGQVAFLEVMDVTGIGAFVDWGLPKQLFVPHAERTADLFVGKKYAFGLYVDATFRLAGTMRVSEMLNERRTYEIGEWIEGEAYRNEPGIGLFVIVERRTVGLLPPSEPHVLSRGEAARFRVANVLPDGKIELSMRGLAHEEIGSDAAKILAVLGGKTPPRVGDKSSPEALREAFGLSKKAVKRAVGHLLREGSVTIGADGFVKLASAPKR